MDRRTFLTGTATVATAALAGCQSNSNQDANTDDTQDTGGEFSIEGFLVEGEQPEEYEAEFIAGNNPEEVAQELQPELNYTITGAEGPIETQTTFEYSDQTIPEGKPLKETVEGETHQQNGEYTQTPQMPDNLVSEIIQNPKNLQATFTATDTQTGETTTQQYQFNFADSYIETAYRNIFNNQDVAISDADLERVNVEDGKINLEYKSENEIGSQEFNNELGNIAGGYSEAVERTRSPYEFRIQARDSNGEVYEKEINDDRSMAHLNGDLTQTELANKVIFEDLWTE